MPLKPGSIGDGSRAIMGLFTRGPKSEKTLPGKDDRDAYATGTANKVADKAMTPDPATPAGEPCSDNATDSEKSSQMGLFRDEKVSKGRRHDRAVENGMQATGALNRSPSALENGVARPAMDDTLQAVKVPGNDTCYEREWLRTQGEGADHDHEDPMTFKRFMLFLAMAFLWIASQIPLFLFGGIIPQIEEEIGGADRYVWLSLGYLIPFASVTPFAGPLSDLFGRKSIALFAATCVVIGSIVVSTAKIMNVFIGGMVLSGVGAGILELTALAVVAESAPTKKRGIYIGLIVLSIIPYCPSTLYAQLVAAHASWRWIGLWTGLWAFVGLVLTALFYCPPRRANRSGLTKKQILKRIDITGGVLSTGGITLFLAGLTWAGNQYPWTSAHVLAPIVIGAVLVIAFGVWEIWLVKYPMFPRQLGQNPRALTAILIITFVSGANFFALLVFWPVQYFVQYATFRDPVSVGIGSLPVGFCIIGGSIVFSILITLFRGRIRIMMITSTVIMTAGNGAMAAARLDNLGGTYAAVSIACFGVGALIVPNQVIATIVCPDDLVATITALTISARFVGGAVAYAIYYHVLRTNFAVAAVRYIAPAAAEAGVRDPVEIGKIAVALSGNLKDAIPRFPGIDTPQKVAGVLFAGRQAFAESYPEVYYVSIAFGGVAVLASCFLPDIGELMDGHVAVRYARR